LNPVAELNGSGAVVSRFVYGSRANVPDYMIQGGVNYRLVTDHLGSVRLVVNASTGAVVSRIDYDVWGNVTASQNLSFQPFGFAGGLRDDATGLVRFGARDYDPHVGRWTGKDPLGINGRDQNVFSYAGNDPVNFLDVNGLTWVEAARFFGNWVIGKRFQSDFGPGTNQVNDMMDAPGVIAAKDFYYKKYPAGSNVGCENRTVTNYGASFGLTSLWKAGLNSTQQFIGSYTVDISTNADGSLNLNLTNATSFTSFLYGLGPSWTGGPGGTQVQNYHWTEPGK
jgi:RHS repeat-associated protein